MRSGVLGVNSTFGFHYFVGFIWVSRCAWIYWMKNQYELSSIFQTFLAKLQIQFTSLFTVTDDAPECLFSLFHQFMNSYGIIYVTSGFYDSWQNRVDLMWSHVTLCLWENAILISCCSSTPSSIIRILFHFMFYSHIRLYIPVNTVPCIYYLHYLLGSYQYFSSISICR